MTRRSACVLATFILSAAASACTSPASQGNPTSGSPTPTPSGTSTPANLCTATGSTTGTGGTLDCLSFAIVGDSRPATINDTAGYPTAIVSQIYQDIQNSGGRPSFVVATGDYQYSSPTGAEGSAQMDKYLGASSAFTGNIFHTMGNHECTGYTDSNCVGAAASSNNTYQAYMSKMLSPLGISKPYYSIKFTATDGSWSAKFVFVAANAWDTTQASWLSTALAVPTTYTFVMRHESINDNTAPGVNPSQAIINGYPLTMLLEGHTHTLRYYSGSKEEIVGIGGAPITGSTNYGYVVVRQRLTDGAIDFSGYDYSTKNLVQHFVVTKAGVATN